MGRVSAQECKLINDRWRTTSSKAVSTRFTLAWARSHQRACWACAGDGEEGSGGRGGGKVFGSGGMRQERAHLPRGQWAAGQGQAWAPRRPRRSGCRAAVPWAHHAAPQPHAPAGAAPPRWGRAASACMTQRVNGDYGLLSSRRVLCVLWDGASACVARVVDRWLPSSVHRCYPLFASILQD